jgi:hypothetical protein
MKINLKSLLKAVLTVSFLLLLTTNSLAYNHETHAFLTQETINFFNSRYSEEISSNLNKYLIDGSRREDDVPRWLNHFYDPIYNRGISYDPAIDPSFAILQALGDQPMSKDWALNSKLQSSFLYKVASKIKPATVASMLTAEETSSISPLDKEVNFTWDRALKLYISGEKEKAMFALGHILHLIQDASVPDHTRNDPHPGDSPYEKYTSQYNLFNPDSSLKERLSSEELVRHNYLSELFQSLAEYSNNNFYSKDTVGIQSGYLLPTPFYSGTYKDSIFTYGFLEKDKYGEFPIIIGGELIGLHNNNLIDDKLIQSAYWTRLSTKAVTYSAATIDLFFKEAERLKDDPEFNKEDKSFIGKAVEAVGDFFSKAGQAFTDMFNQSREEVIDEIPLSQEKLKEENEAKPFVFVDKTSVKLGETIIESGSGFTPKANIDLFFSLPSGKEVSVKVLSDENGQFNHEYTIHWSAETGLHYYWAKDISTGFTTDKVKYQVIPAGQKEPAKTILADKPKKENPGDEENDKNKENNEEFSIQLPKECFFLSEGTSQLTQKVVINEVAWMGSAGSASDEWIELRNISSSEADISGWWLMDQKEQIKTVIPNNTIIPVNGFYLLERSDDESVPGVKADMIYSGTLSNSNEGLRLLNPQCLVEDEVLADPSWPAGDSSKRKTMEKSENLADWHTSELVDGTPKQKNSKGEAISNNDSKSQTVHYNPGSSSSGKTSVPACSQIGLSAPSKEIIINEVAWAGDKISSTNEWIELYNTTDTDIDISGWQLLDKAENIKIDFPEGEAIKAGSYYLMLRGEENFIPGKEADIFFTGAINNSDETLRLFGEDCVLVDEIKDTGSSWNNFGGSASPDYKTAERGNDNSWHSYSGSSAEIMGTPGMENSEDTSGDGNNNGEEDEGDEGGSGSSWGSESAKLVISEIMPGTAKNVNDEFIELYNPTSLEISLDGWSLKKKATLSGQTSNLVSAGSEGLKGLSIAPKGFFLIASQQYSGSKTPDVYYSQDTNFLANNGDIIVFYNYKDEPIIVTEYSEIEMGNSWERKAFSEGVCFKAQNDWEFSGNGCNADDQVVWNIRQDPSPQNTDSLLEPRDPPVWPFSSSSVSALYNADKIAADFSWPSFDGVVNINELEEIVWSGPGTDAQKSIKLYELGSTKNFSFSIADRDGLSSNEKASFSISAPRLVDDFKLYSATKLDVNGEEKERNIIEFSWNEYPFIPRDIGLALPYGESPHPNYKILVFYKNMDVPDDPFLIFDKPDNKYSDSVAEVCYQGEDVSYECRKSLIFSDKHNTSIYGAPYRKALKHSPYLEDGDNMVAIPINRPVSEGDYFTVGYYAFYRTYPQGTPESEGHKQFILVAKDNTHISLSEVPMHQPPSAPANIGFNIKDGTKLYIFWEESTDPDTPDKLIRYEISYDNGETWKRTAPGEKISVNSGEIYNPLIRAIDDFGLMSENSTIEINIPLPNS